MRISDWSSDVCSSDLGRGRRLRMVSIPLGELLGNTVEPFVEHRLRTRVQRRERPDDPRLALGDDEIGVRHDEKRRADDGQPQPAEQRSEEHTSELQSLMRTSYAGFCLKKKQNNI